MFFIRFTLLNMVDKPGFGSEITVEARLSQ